MNEFIGKWRQFITEDKTPLRENFEIGDTVVMKGDELGVEEMVIVDKRNMFASNLQAFTVQHNDGSTAEYDETQLARVPTDVKVDLDEELFTPNEMGDKAVEDESNSPAFQEGKGQDLADKYVAKLRSEFGKLNDDELDEFKKTIAQSLDLNESVNEVLTRADFYKQIEKVAFTAGWDSYMENANVEDAWYRFSAQQDAAQEEPKSYAAGGGSDFIDPMELRETSDDKNYFASPTLANKATLHKGLKRQIKDIEDSLESGESDGEPLTNETAMILQHELTKLKKKLKNVGGVNEGLPKGFWDKKIDAKDEDQDGKVDESYATLVNKIEKSGKSEKAAKAIAGAVASYKSKGGGKGPTAKQK